MNATSLIRTEVGSPSPIGNKNLDDPEERRGAKSSLSDCIGFDSVMEELRVYYSAYYF